MLHLDGAAGEGGGQILRTALSLSLCTGRAFRITAIRARRRRPGLQPQHLTAVQAAAVLCGAQVEGDRLGSDALTFAPGPVRPGRYRFDIGTAGSTALLLQTVLPPLLFASGPSEVTVLGGTHNPQAPPFEFLDEAFLPLLRRMGARLAATLVRAGFHPVGGGEVHARVHPVAALSPLDLHRRGPLLAVTARALLANLPDHIARRELAVVGRTLGIAEAGLELVRLEGVRGAGNAVLVAVRSAGLTEVFCALGRRGLPAEAVAADAAGQARAYLRGGAPVAEHLGDQLLLPLSLAGGGGYRCSVCSSHMRTNRDAIAAFLPVRVDFRPAADGTWEVEVDRP